MENVDFWTEGFVRSFRRYVSPDSALCRTLSQVLGTTCELNSSPTFQTRQV